MSIDCTDPSLHSSIQLLLVQHSVYSAGFVKVCLVFITSRYRVDPARNDCDRDILFDVVLQLSFNFSRDTRRQQVCKYRSLDAPFARSAAGEQRTAAAPLPVVTCCALCAVISRTSEFVFL